MADKKYLRVTIFDNDFTSRGCILGQMLYNLILAECYDDGEVNQCFLPENLKALEPVVAKCWAAAHYIVMNLRFGSKPDENYTTEQYMLDCIKLSVVSADDIAELDDYMNILVPLFEGGEVLVR